MLAPRKVRLLPLQLKSFFLIVALFQISFFASVQANTEDGAATFNAKCSGCHTLGKGTLVGPDLAAGKSWTDENLADSIKRMEQTVGPLSSDETVNLVEFLKSTRDLNSNPSAKSTQEKEKDKESNSTASADTNKSPDKAPVIELGSAIEGEELFDGRRPFKNGGMSCNACHSVNGSSTTMGPDLTRISEKMNEAALLASCQQTPFKVMKAAYAQHPIDRQEALNLTKYLLSVKEKPRKKEVPVAVAGAVASVLFLLVLAFGYRNRNTNVRDKLQRR